MRPEEKKEEMSQDPAKPLPVVITCIHYDAAGNDHTNENGEWIALRARKDIYMSGWLIRDDADNEYEFPDNFQLEKGQSARIYTGSSNQPKDRGDCGSSPDHELYWGSGSAIWNNGGDIASLVKHGKTITSCSYPGGGTEAYCTPD